MNVAETVDQAVAAELLQRVLYLHRQVRGDRKHADALVAGDFEEFGTAGQVLSRAETLARLGAADFEAPIVEDFQCRKLSARVVLVTYRAVRTDAETGERQTTLCSSVWSKRAKSWVLRFHQGTRANAAAALREAPKPRDA